MAAPFLAGRRREPDGTHSVRWAPECTPLLRQALQHLALGGCPVSQRQLADTYGRTVSSPHRARPGSPVKRASSPMKHAGTAFEFSAVQTSDMMIPACCMLHRDGKPAPASVTIGVAHIRVSEDAISASLVYK